MHISHRVHIVHTMSTPSSRRSARSGRGSVAATPSRAARGTPQRSSQGNAATATSSPLFFQGSSPAKSTPRQSQQSQRSNGNVVISSPPRQSSSVAGDQEKTPRATKAPAVAGKYCRNYVKMHANATQTLHQYDMIRVQVQAAPSNQEQMPLLAAAGSLSGQIPEE